MSRIFALADLHGQYQMWQKIKGFLNSDDKIYFLGDAIDRGQYGYELMRDLLTDNRIIYIKGNHEQMMEDALREIQRQDGAYVGEAFQLWSWNGCSPTINAWAEHGAMYDWIHVLHEMPFEETYINKSGKEICMCHAGFTPGAKSPWNYELVWNREHVYNEIPEEYRDCHLIVVHGHTPTFHLMMDFDELNRELVHFYSDKDNVKMIPQHEYTEVDGAVFYGNGTKIDIDCGCFFTGHAVLLDLDTFEVIGFDAETDDPI